MEKVNAKIHTYKINRVVKISSEKLLLLFYNKVVKTNLMGALWFSILVPP